jgi:hypothetical protein
MQMYYPVPCGSCRLRYEATYESYNSAWIRILTFSRHKQASDTAATNLLPLFTCARLLRPKAQCNRVQHSTTYNSPEVAVWLTKMAQAARRSAW